MMEMDNKWKYKLSPTTSIYKTILALVIAEVSGLIAVYDFVGKFIFGIQVPHLIIPTECLIIYVVGMVWLHRIILGSKERIDYYKKIFDEWEPAKQAKWKLSLVVIMLMPFGFLFLVVGFYK
jgi:hypothetical protein